MQLNAWGTVGYWDNWRMRFFSNVLATLTLVPLIVGLVQGYMRGQSPREVAGGSWAAWDKRVRERLRARTR